MVAEEKAMPSPKTKPPVPKHVGFTDTDYFTSKRAMLAYLDATEQRYQRKAAQSTDVNTVRASYNMAQAASRVRHQLNPVKEDQLFAEPVDIPKRLAEVYGVIDATNNPAPSAAIAAAAAAAADFDDDSDIDEV